MTITVSCPQCGASGNLDETKRPAGVTSISCPRCGHSFPFPPPATTVAEASLQPCSDCGAPIEGGALRCNSCEAARNRQNDTAPASPAERRRCPVCKGEFATAAMIRYGDRLVCAGCKDTYARMCALGMTAPDTAAGHGSLTREELLARPYRVEIGQSLSRGWQLFRDNAGLLLGGSFLVYLVMMIAGMVPFLGSLASLVLTGPFMGGLWMLYIKKIRGEAATVNDAFSGFSSSFTQLMLSGVVTSLLSWMILGASIVPLALSFGFNGLFQHSIQLPAPTLLIPAILLLLVGMAGFTYLTVCWLFALPLVIDKRLEFWTAMQLSREMVHRQWWLTFAFCSVLGLVCMLGFLLFFIGSLVSMPVAFAAMVAHYQNVFGELRQES